MRPHQTGAAMAVPHHEPTAGQTYGMVCGEPGRTCRRCTAKVTAPSRGTLVCGNPCTCPLVLGCPPPRDLIPTKHYAGLGASHGLVSGLEPGICRVRPPKYPRVRLLNRPHHTLRWQRGSPRHLAASDMDAMGIAIAPPLRFKMARRPSNSIPLWVVGFGVRCTTTGGGRCSPLDAQWPMFGQGLLFLTKWW